MRKRDVIHKPEVSQRQRRTEPCNGQKTLCEVRPRGSRQVRADRQTDRHALITKPRAHSGAGRGRSIKYRECTVGPASTASAAAASDDVTMTSRGHMILVHATESVTLECEFRARRFSLFDNPVVWHKTQRGDPPTQVNILSNIVEPFIAAQYRADIPRDQSPRSVLVVTSTLRGTSASMEFRLTAADDERSCPGRKSQSGVRDCELVCDAKPRPVEPFFETGRLSVAFLPADDDDVYRMSLRLRGTTD